MERNGRASAVSDAVRLATVLRQYRARCGLTQRELARRTGYSRSSVANAESGEVRSAEFYRRCDEALTAGGAILAVRRSLEAPAPAPAPPSSPTAERLRQAPVAEALAHLRRHWSLLARAETLLGPEAALPTVLEHLATLATLVASATGPTRSALLSLSARYASTASRLHSDAGQAGTASLWAGRALEWAHESGDRRTLAWALARRGRACAAAGDDVRALAFALAAARARTSATAARGALSSASARAGRTSRSGSTGRRAEAAPSPTGRPARYSRPARAG
ncbi:helix-turn-helix transcriptional regulator [Cryptosporangium sp. NPDC051539]|uniref:helix-turn-helix transcriptional regulator n=1 Tax=Cryptosporangium sp. NPDC051539 TaxID=3363962 RepID=UPI0037B0D9F3